MRLLALLGRIGTSLLALGLAFALVSIIPPAPLGTWGGPGYHRVKPDRYAGTSFGTFTPRTGFQLSLTANNSIEFYILDNFPESEERKPSYLEAYLQENPDEIFFSATVDEELSIDFFPPRISEVWFVYSNPSATVVNVTLTFRFETILVSKEQVQMPTIVLLISGGIFTLPRYIGRRKKHNGKKGFL